MLTTIIVCILAGLGAGLGTGFAGMSAAAVISPMLITFLGMDPYHGGGNRIILRTSLQVRCRRIHTEKIKISISETVLIMMVSSTFIYRLLEAMCQVWSHFRKYHGELFQSL